MSEEPQIRDAEWVRSMLPHRYPILLVDRVLELEPERTITALKNVTLNEEFFQGHFPERPVMPGVLIIEGMAQAGAILLLSGEGRRDTLMYLMSIERARFRRPVVPGDQLRYEVEVLRLRSSHAKLRGRALVDGNVVAEALVSSAFVER